MLNINIYILYIVKRHIESFVSKRFYVTSMCGYLLGRVRTLHICLPCVERETIHDDRPPGDSNYYHSFLLQIVLVFPSRSILIFYLFIYIEIQNHTKNINSFSVVVYFYRYIPNQNHECCCCFVVV